MQEKWIRWEPVSGLSKKYHSKLISNSYSGGFVINLADESDKRISIKFSGSVISYRVTSESHIFNTLTFLENNYESKFYSEWTFFKIENSEYLEWMKKQLIIEDYIPLTHLCILADDLMLDFITTYEPEVKHIK